MLVVIVMSLETWRTRARGGGGGELCQGGVWEQGPALRLALNGHSSVWVPNIIGPWAQRSGQCSKQGGKSGGGRGRGGAQGSGGVEGQGGACGRGLPQVVDNGMRNEIEHCFAEYVMSTLPDGRTAAREDDTAREFCQESSQVHSSLPSSYDRNCK